MQGTSGRLIFGHSEMAERVRTSSWDTHELGPIATWPVALRAALTTCFASNTPMQLWWGPQFATFYNDACIPLLGDRHPTALGRHAPDLLGERWRTICSSAEHVRTSAAELEVDGMHLVPLLDGRGSVEGVLCAVAESDSEDDEIRSHADRRGCSDFLSLIGHELRNPLSAMSTTMQVFEMRGSSQEVELMQRSIRHLTRLVDDLLDVSRLDSGQLVLRRKHVELTAVVDRALEIMSPIAEKRGVKVFVHVPRSGMAIDGDGERLARAFARVLTNALDHSDPESPVTFEAIHDGKRARITITDRGTGLTTSQLEHAFEAFHSDRATGLGVGLAISRGIVELHGGTIALHSKGLGHGAECVIELPLVIDHELGRPRLPVAQAVRKRVLLVEDNDDTARALAIGLQHLGYQVAVAHDGPVALSLARDFEPDVVLLDIGLPVMDGWELARRMRERVHDLHVIAVTARDQDRDREQSASGGFADHLVKPIDLVDLQRLIESLPHRARWAIDPT